MNTQNKVRENRKYVRCISKYVRPILKYLGHIFCPKRRMCKLLKINKYFIDKILVRKA